MSLATTSTISNTSTVPASNVPTFSTAATDNPSLHTLTPSDPSLPSTTERDFAPIVTDLATLERLCDEQNGMFEDGRCFIPACGLKPENGPRSSGSYDLKKLDECLHPMGPNYYELSAASSRGPSVREA